MRLQILLNVNNFNVSFTEYGKRCNYEVLGISPSATSEEIKKAYYEKCKIYHPDINNDSEADQIFREINVAYEVLSNEESRTNYDMSRGYQKSVIRESIKPRHHSPNDYEIYTRNMYHRMRQKEYEKIKPSIDYESLLEKIAEEKKFYESLDEEMKKKYEEYYIRNKENRTEKYNTDNKSQLILICLLFSLLIYFGSSTFDFSSHINKESNSSLDCKNK